MKGKETKQTVSVNHPSSLLEQCTKLVATHLDSVESFCSLPSLIGETIFRAGCDTERFKTDIDYSTQAVRLFTDAYGDEFLSSLNVSGEYLGLNYCLEQLLLFTDLVQLDVSDCGLGDDHEILSHFQHCHRLEVLNLSGNAVSNVGVQKMTAPYRMFSRGPAQLTLVDFTDNGAVSRQCLKYLTMFQSIHTVLFTEHSIEQIGKCGSWTLSQGCATRVNIYTEGWAKVLIDRWMLEARQKSKLTRKKSTTGLFSIKKCPLRGNGDREGGDVQSINLNRKRRQHLTIIANRLQKSEGRPDCRVSYSGGKGIDKSNAGSSHSGVVDVVDAKCDIKTIQDLYKMKENAKPSPHKEMSLQVLEFCDTGSLVPDLGQGTNTKTNLSKSCGEKHFRKNEYMKTVTGENANPFCSNGKNIRIPTMYRNKTRMKKGLKESNSLLMNKFLDCHTVVDGNSSKHVTDTQVGILNGILQEIPSDSSLQIASVDAKPFSPVNAKLMTVTEVQSRSEPKLNTKSESSVATNSIHTKCVPTLNIKSMNTESVLAAGTKSRKRKRIVIKKSDSSDIFKCEKVDGRVDIENGNVVDIDQDHERSGKKIRLLKSDLIYSLDGYI